MYRSPPRDFKKFADPNVRPSIHWEGTANCLLQIEYVVTPKPGMPPHKNDWCVVIGKLLPECQPDNMTLKRMGPTYIKVTGSIANVREGDTYTFVGKWLYDKKDNPSWSEWIVKGEGFAPSAPVTIGAISEYLQGINHIGPARASMLTGSWKLKTLEKLEELYEYTEGVSPDSDPAIQEEYLARIPEEDVRVFAKVRLGGSKLIEVLNEVHQKRDLFAVTQILVQAGIESSADRKAVLDTYRGQPFKEAVLADPLALADLDGISFKKADNVWRICGLDPNDVRRLSAGVLEALKISERSGNCWAETRECLSEAAKQLNKPDMADVWFGNAYSPQELREKDLQQVPFENHPEVQRVIAVDANGNMWRRVTLDAEQNIAERIQALSAHSGQLPVDKLANLEEDFKNLFEAEGFPYGEDQLAAACLVMRNTFVILEGSAGTGKTTILKYILAMFNRKGVHDIMIMAPTGAAARRATSATKRRCTTIHRGIGYGGHSPEYCLDNPLPCKVLVADEVSMLDVHLASHLLNAVRAGTHVILVGDFKQLPSVGPGAILRDLRDSGVIPIAKLTTVHRNNSTPLRLADSIQKPEEAFQVVDSAGRQLYDDLEFVSISDRLKIVEEVVRRYVEIGDPDRVKAIACTNGTISEHPETKQKGYWDAGVIHLNNAISAAMLPPKQPGEMTIGKFRKGHRCIWLKNTTVESPFQMVNGQDFDIIDIFMDDDDIASMKIKTFNDEGVEVEYTFQVKDYPNHFDLGYARTVNKAQGAGYEHILFVVRWPEGFLSTERAYTGVTRTEKKCIIIGKPEKLWDTKPEVPNRQTLLKERLIQLMKKKEVAA
jgi:exodeoxyribonuclease V alpha subunit